jgi:hypothetical protein
VEENISMGTASGLFSVEAYNEIVISSAADKVFSTVANTEVLLTCREKPPLTNCILEPEGLIKNSKLTDYGSLSAIRVYPNPTRRTTTIELSNEDQIIHGIKVYNSLGMMVHERNLITTGSKVEVDLSGFGEGVYFIRVLLNDNECYMSKIIKQN